jgi:hypothetical protein
MMGDYIPLAFQQEVKHTLGKEWCTKNKVNGIPWVKEGI